MSEPDKIRGAVRRADKAGILWEACLTVVEARRPQGTNGRGRGPKTRRYVEVMMDGETVLRLSPENALKLTNEIVDVVELTRSHGRANTTTC